MPPHTRPTVVVARLLGALSAVVVLWAGVLTPAYGSEESDQSGVWPLLPRPDVLHGFEPSTQPWQPGHRGVDLRAAVGAVLRAPKAGRVTFAGVIAGIPTMVIDHGAVRSTFQPATTLLPVGSAVSMGMAVGRVSPGLSHCWPVSCLHWGLIRNATDPPVYVDPIDWLGHPEIRLLPLWGTPSMALPMVLLRPRVGLFERPPQAVSADMRVELRRRE